MEHITSAELGKGYDTSIHCVHENNCHSTSKFLSDEIRLKDFLDPLHPSKDIRTCNNLSKDAEEFQKIDIQNAEKTFNFPFL